MTDEERALRVDLAACYRIVALMGWDDFVFTHISARLPGTEEFLINPYGMMFDEITASSLIRVDHECRPQHETTWPVNPAGFVIHSAIHEARPDVGCVLHTHTTDGVAVSAQEAGLLPISQQATIALSSLAYHDYEGIAVRDDEKPRLVADLGTKHRLILRNHGLLTVGPTVPDALMSMITLQRACEIQIRAQSGGGALIIVDPKIVHGVRDAVKTVTRGAGSNLLWPALLRKLDRESPGYRD
jgi:ribulose-5-phosphate 4-epimerase/fuculose-1-phosphate aldolase